MKILLIQDEGIKIDLERSSNILNSICNTIKFESYKNAINLDSPSSYINLEKEIAILNQTVSSIEKDYTIYITYRRYGDNYFAHSAQKTMILSFFGWEHYTNLPLENGLFYFIADVLALRIERSFRHQELTGCIYDFLWDKTGVDMGMKMAFICEDCLMRIENNVKKSKVSSNISPDLIEILNLISSASKWGKSVFELEKDKSMVGLNWSTFEDEVAQLYRELGAIVKQNVNLSGFQIDIYLEEETPSRQKIRTAVECKFYKSKVGNRIVNDYSRIVQTLKESGLVDKGIIVSYSGFSQDAFLVSKETGIELLLFEDLKERVGVKKVPQKEELKYSTELIMEEIELQIKERKEKSPKIFVLMPFSPDLDDVYHLGIRETAKILNCSCERVDEIEFVGSILELLRYKMI
ncbi:MAG: restriction endonuclease [Halobacteriota archaeon]